MKKRWAGLFVGIAFVGVAEAALVAEWNFDNQNLVNTGASMGEHNGFVVSGPDTNRVEKTASYTTDTPSGSGYALDLSTLTDYMVVTNSSTNFTGYVDTFDSATDFSYSMWIKNMDGIWEGWNEMAGKGSEVNNQGWAMRSKYSNTTRVSFYHDTEGDDDALDGTGVHITDGLWHLYTFSYDSTASALTLYIDGVEVGADMDASMADAIGRNLVFGGRDDGTRIDRVLFDTVQFYDHALSASEVSSLYIVQTGFFVDADEISMELISPDSIVTGSVAVSYTSDADINVNVSISNETHTGFSVLTTVPFTMTDPSPSNTLIEIEFDMNEAGGMTNGEVASCSAVITWNKSGDSDITEVIIPVRVAYKAAISVGTPVLWDIGVLSNGENMLSTAADFVAAGVTEDIDGAEVSNVNGAQNMTDGFITVNLSTYRNTGLKAGATYTGAGAALIREYSYLKSTDAMITIGGLSDRLAASTEYRLYLWGKGDAPEQNSTFTYDGVSITTSTNNPTTSDATNFVATFSFTTDAVVADTLTVDWSRAASTTYTALNGFAIVPAYSLTPAEGEAAIEIINGGTQYVLRIDTSEGSLYSVEVTDDLAFGSWSNVAVDVAGVNGGVTFTNTISEDVLFYRAYRQE